MRVDKPSNNAVAANDAANATLNCGPIGSALRAAYAEVGVSDITRGYGRRFHEAVIIEAEAHVKIVDESEMLTAVAAVVRRMKADGFDHVEGWFAFLDKEQSAFGLAQHGGPIAGALHPRKSRDEATYARARLATPLAFDLSWIDAPTHSRWKQ